MVNRYMFLASYWSCECLLRAFPERDEAREELKSQIGAIDSCMEPQRA